MSLARMVSEEIATIDQNLASAADTALVAAAQSGDSLAFVELCRRHSQRLLRRLYGITKNRHDAEDALQDALMSAFRNLDRFENRSAFSSWLTAIATNSALMTLRKRRGAGDPFDEGVDYLYSRNASPESYCEQRERDRLINRAIRRLPPMFRSVMELRVSQELSIQEIAHNLAISESAVKSRLARARKRMRASLRRMELKRTADLALLRPGTRPPAPRSSPKRGLTSVGIGTLIDESTLKSVGAAAEIAFMTGTRTVPVAQNRVRECP